MATTGRTARYWKTWRSPDPFMLQKLRLFVTLALLVAVPMQGIAAVAGSLCMAFGETPQQAHHDDAAGSSHDHGSGDDDGASHSHCGPCVACCATTAIAGGVSLPLPAAVASTPQAASLPAPGTLRRDKLDRPPLAA
jgi:hypothetical protein